MIYVRQKNVKGENVYRVTERGKNCKFDLRYNLLSTGELFTQSCDAVLEIAVVAFQMECVCGRD